MEAGKKVKEIFFGNGEKLVSSADSVLESVTEYHGAYHIDWVIQKTKTGIEVSRHNTIFIESIVWGDVE